MALREELIKLTNAIHHICHLVEEEITNSISSILKGDKALADEVIRKDDLIDALEVEIEDECLKILAEFHPESKDLRFTASVLKINNDLERIADLAVNIAERTVDIIPLHKKETGLPLPDKLALMTEKASSMVRDATQAFIHLNRKQAKEIIYRDTEVDNLNREIIDAMGKQITQDLSFLKEGLCLISISKYLERIADHATNIAEDVIYLIDGEIVRHR